ncbi:hypothetical protein FOA52_000187 [Chlamydomonas sp. UWO 241]|nr:hypothetical protein FOA52_000187 [Chlamydomonas sp. UWO 241]
MSADDHIPRVLSIQSHVVHGYVGNKCAVLTLQLLGFEVDPVNSVQFSNHAGYPSFKGAVHDGAHLQSILAGLEANGITKYSHLLTGYVGSASLLREIASVCRQLRAWNPGLTYLCDPVLGDEGRLYVPEELVAVYQEEVLPLASVLVPNQFEAELLAGTTIGSAADGFAACQLLHDKGPHTVIITSANLPGREDTILLLASTTRPQAKGTNMQQLVLEVPKIHAYFTGTGDLLASLLLGRTHQHPDNLAAAIDEAIASLQAVLSATAATCNESTLAMKKPSSDVCNRRELRLVQNQGAITGPVTGLRCAPWSEYQAAGKS